MFSVKLQVIANCRKLKEETGKCPSIVLVLTVVRGVNDHQIGDIASFAFENADVVCGVNFQPVAFIGRITREEVTKGRFTLTDLVTSFGEQIGFTNRMIGILFLLSHQFPISLSFFSNKTESHPQRIHIAALEPKYSWMKKAKLFPFPDSSISIDFRKASMRYALKQNRPGSKSLCA
jgi:uncharacterized radical SAM superfamily Fe-S cluster-containing enzyme